MFRCSNWCGRDRRRAESLTARFHFYSVLFVFLFLTLVLALFLEISASGAREGPGSPVGSVGAGDPPVIRLHVPESQDSDRLTAAVRWP